MQNGHITESQRVVILSLCFRGLLLGFKYFMNMFLKKMKPHHLLRDGQGPTANALCKKLLNGAVGADCFKNIATKQQAKST